MTRTLMANDASTKNPYRVWAVQFLSFAVVSLILLWPAALNRSPLVFSDTVMYLRQADSVVKGVSNVFGAHAPSAAGPAAGSAGQRKGAALDGKPLRSIGYPALMSLALATPLGAAGALLMQAMIVLGMVALVARGALRGREGSIWATIGPCIFLSSLPWFCSYLMPDVFAAVILLFGIWMVQDHETANPAAQLFVLASSAFASLVHYGHIPLQLGVSIMAVVVLALQRRLSVSKLIFCLAPAIIAIGCNISASSVAFHKPSMMPKQMPIPLARSIEDGPARWHLQRHCREYNYTICKIYHNKVPENTGDLLWNESTSIFKVATSTQQDQIRREEAIILWRSALEFPLQQTWSLIHNVVRQLVTFGLGDIRWRQIARGPDGQWPPPDPRSGSREGLDAIADVQFAVVAVSALALLWWVAADRRRAAPREREMIFMLVAGLLLNAAIFGGLSAPADRYQARVIWLVPLLATLCALQRLRRASPDRRPGK